MKKSSVRTAGSPGEQAASAGQDISVDSDEPSWAVIRIEFPMRGRFVTAPKRPPFMESEVNQPRWTQASEFARAMARTIEDTFSLGANTLHLRMHYVDLGDQQVQPEIHLIAPGITCPDRATLREITTRFGAGLTSQSDLLDSPSSESLSPECEQHIDDNVSLFLEAHGGQAVQKSLQILVEDQPVSTVRGHWRQEREGAEQEPQQRVLEGLYDGRRLRARTLYVSHVGETSRSVEIFYDEERFDHRLRELADNKNAELRLTVSEIPCGKGKKRYELIDFERIPMPDHLDLSPSGPAAA